MVNLTHSTKSIKEKNIRREWHLFDIKNQILGRTATQISNILSGKHKPSYVEYLDQGDYVVVINAAAVVISGNKKDSKVYTRYSGYPGGMKTVSYKRLSQDRPEEVVRHAVSGMLPKNKLRDRRLTRLFIYADANHPYKDKLSAQVPSSQKTS